MISIQNVTKRYGPTVAVNRASFEVQRGEVLGFLGPNGAGKTTTMRILTCFMPADEGTVTVAGYDVFRDSLEVRRRIGYLPENAPLYTDMKVEEFLEYIGEIRQLEPERRRRRILEMIEVCGLGSVLGKNTAHLSRGFRQRVGLAQAMLHDPEILVLDEPTLGLDPNQIIEIRELIKRVGEQKTIILCSHILPEVQATCSRIVIINEGRIVASGTPEELSRQAGGAPLCYLTVRGPAAEVRRRLELLPEVAELRPVGEPVDDRQRFLATGREGSEMGEALFRAVAEAGWTLSELRPESATLENVFTRLTVGERL